MRARTDSRTRSASDARPGMWIMAEPLFADRAAAGRALAESLASKRFSDSVVVGLARGGVVAAAPVARALGAPLDAVAVRKIGHPLQPEYALGAVTPENGVYVRGAEQIDEAALARAIDRAKTAARELDRRLHLSHPAVDRAGRRVILVDDGLATGATMIAAARWARAGGAAEVVAAVPVAPFEAVAGVRAEVDELLALYERTPFGAVALWYERFPPVGDDAVVRLLDEASARAAAPAAAT